MSQLQDNFNAIIAKIEERITDADELNFIKERIAEISMLYIDELNKIMDLSERRVNKVFENQKILEKKLEVLENSMSNMKEELFVEDDYDFEIICPYCNHEFVSDIDSKKKEVKCPECGNTIELDWNEEAEHECAGHCGSCGGCGHDEECDDSEEQQENNNEDDM